MRTLFWLELPALIFCGALALACGSSSGARNGSEAGAAAGASNDVGGSVGTGGSVASGGAIASGGTVAPSGGSASGGAATTTSGGTNSAGTGAGDGICPGASPVPAGYPICRTVADCPPAPGGLMSCAPEVPSYSPVGCGPLPCDSDADCVDRVCETTGCQFNEECVPKCTADSCAAGMQCAASGHCEAISCTAGFTCPSNYVCAPDRPSVNAHGCGIARCDLDGYHCPAGSTCDADPTQGGSGCRSLPCNAGGVCAVNFRCDDAKGTCAKLSCTKDADCDCGACVSSHCEARLFVCVGPVVGATGG
jgi:hypothetical protein